MKLEKTTIALLIIAGLSIIAFSIFQSPSNDKNSVKPIIFNFDQEVINNITIITQTQRIELERIDPLSQGNNQLANWKITKPESTFAKEAIVTYLLDLIKRKSIKTFTIDRLQLAEYGLTKPFGEIKFKLNDNKQHYIILGNTDYSQNNIYALINTPPTSNQLSINLVPIEFKYAIDRPLKEWKQ